MSARSDQELGGHILGLLQEHDGRAVALRRLLQALMLPVTARRRVRRILQDLVRDGRVVAEGRGRYSRAGPGCERVGVLRRRGRGLATLELPPGQAEEVRIRAEDRGGALPGDRVRVLVLHRRFGNPSVGRVVEILERGGRPLVGTLQRRGRAFFVLPEEPEVSGAIRVEPPSGEAPQGCLVAVAIDDPLPRLRPHGRVIRVLGERGELATEVARLVIEHQLEIGFPPEIEAETACLRPDSDSGQRVDLRAQPVVTIDPPDAKDFDDAVAVERLYDGFLLQVSIADVASFVPAGGATDREALRRGCSVYLPGTVYPMLPPELSEDRCSLAPGQDRLAVTVELHLDGTGAVRGGRIFRSLVRSCARLSYAQVQEALDRGPGREPIERLRSLLEDMAACARLLLRRLAERGALDLDLPESEIELDQEGEPVGVHPSVRHFSCRIIEAFMIAANEAVGRVMQQASAPAVYRVHPPPDPEKIEAFSSLARSLGVELRLGPTPSSGQVSAMLRSLEGQPARATLNQLLLRSLMAALYRSSCDGHFGLASPCYLHFTSPIRRYPDLAVHRQLGALLDLAGPAGIAIGQDLPPVSRWPLSPGGAAEAAERSTAAERLALEVERQAQALYHAAFLRRHLGEVFDGAISFVTEFGVFVRIAPSGIEGLVHLSRMRNDAYRFDPDRLVLFGRRRGRTYRVGMPVRVQVAAANLSERQIDFEFVPDPGGQP